VIKEHFGRRVDDWVLGLAPAVRRIPLTPDQLTLLGVLLSGVVAGAYALGWVQLAGLLLIAAGACDLIDGIVARIQGTESRAGAFFDSTMDRVSDLLIFSGMLVGAARTGSPWLAMLVCWALSGAVMTSYTRARAEVELGEFTVGWMERAERCLVLLVFSLANQLILGLWVIAIGSTATAVVRLVLALKQIDSADSPDAPHLESAPLSAPELHSSQPESGERGSARTDG